MSFDEKTYGVHLHAWRNVIARESLAEKEDYISADNPEKIPSPRNVDRYQDQNFIQCVQPLQLFRPFTLAGGAKTVTQKDGTKKNEIDPVNGGLRGIVQAAKAKGLKVKAVGSGHSFSDVANTSDFLVMTDNLNEILENTTSVKSTNGLNIRHYPWLKYPIKKHGYSFFLSAMSGQSEDINAKSKGSRKFYGDPKEKPGIVEFEAGIKIRDLNEELWKRGWSLYNMGTYQGQSFIGAASTSTHGSGHKLPPLPDMILSMVLVADGGLVYRIEPQNGITQPGSNATEKDFTGPIPQGFLQLLENHHIFKTSETNVDFLIQDDDWFASALVNVGTFGIIYSVIIEVIPRYYLLETVEYSTWEKVAERLITSEGWKDIFEEKEFTARFPVSWIVPCGSDNYESELSVSEIRTTTIEVHPHDYGDGSERGEHICRIMRQYKVIPDRFSDSWKSPGKGRLAGNEFLENVILHLTKSKINSTVEPVEHDKDRQGKWYENVFKITALALMRPVTGDIAETAYLGVFSSPGLKRLMKSGERQPNCRLHYLNRNYYTQFVPLFRAYGVELAFGTKNTSVRNIPPYIDAMNRILDLARESWEYGRHMQTSPVALRMVRASNAYLSMQYSDDTEPTCMIELLNQNDTHGGKELFYRYERELFRYGARPHWGLDLSVTTGNNNLLKKMYPGFSHWKLAYDSFNVSGTFNNRFTDRMGLSDQK